MIKPLTSLRFLFALMVFTCHFCLIDITNPGLKNVYDNVFFEGYLGVSFFFILSGFVLALNYKSKLTSNKITAKEFLVARIARIYPLHVVTLLLSIPLLNEMFMTDTFRTICKFFINLFLMQSFVPIMDVYFSFNVPSWSISDEFFFYLLFPLILGLFFRFKKSQSISLLILLIIPVSVAFFPDNLEHRFFYINPFYRIADFVIGILLYNVYERRFLEKRFISKISATAFELIAVAIFVGFFYFHGRIPMGYRYSSYYWIPMALIIFVFSYQSGFLSKILSNRYLVLFGEISYSFYLLHFLIIRYTNKYLPTDNEFVIISVAFCTAMVASYFSYRHIEQPANRFIKMKYKEIVLRKASEKLV